MQQVNGQRILEKMMERLLAALANGPGLNCRPHSSRQRIDLTQFARLDDRTPEQILRALLGTDRESKVTASVARPRKLPLPRRFVRTPPAQADQPEQPEQPPQEKEELSPEEKAAVKAWLDQQAVLNKLKTIAEDARTYENDTGVHILHLGFPLLSLPPGSANGTSVLTRRILAPLAFISLTLSLKGGPRPSVVMECRNDGADLVVPNMALLAWLQQQAGKEIGELDDDSTGEKPWDEIAQVVQQTARLLDLAVPEAFSAGEKLQESLTLIPAPRADETDAGACILSSAVIGLFPMANEGLIRDTRAMLGGEALTGPVEGFLRPGVLEDAAGQEEAAEALTTATGTRNFSDERLVAAADPCQARAVKLSRQSRLLVIHGPPGTGKSQTITNIIGDHLAQGQRVLFVCDKRTALDVVMNRLETLGLGRLCAVVHDPQRDQRDLYRSIREQLDELPELKTNATAAKELARLDQELQSLHAELARCHAALMKSPNGSSASFHELVGQWLELPDQAVQFDGTPIQHTLLSEFETHQRLIQETVDRAVACAHTTNPWVLAADVKLAEYLSKPAQRLRELLSECAAKARVADDTADPAIPAFSASIEPHQQAKAREALAAGLDAARQQIAAPLLGKWTASEATVIQTQIHALQGLEAHLETISQPLPTDFAAVVMSQPPALKSVLQQIMTMDAYAEASGGIFGFLAFSKKKAAREVLSAYGIPWSSANAAGCRKNLMGLRARLMVQQACERLLEFSSPVLRDDAALLASMRQFSALFQTLSELERDPSLQPLRQPLAAAGAAPEKIEAFIAGLRKSSARAAAIVDLDDAIDSTALFRGDWRGNFHSSLCRGEKAGPTVERLAETLPTLGDILRIREAAIQLPEPLRKATIQFIHQGLGADVALPVLRKQLLSQEIMRRLRSDTSLQAVDAQKLASMFQRYSELETRRLTLARAAILHLWVQRHRDRLLAGTGTRLNGLGADLRRRLMLRGERAMRLRQVVAAGRNVDDGDPLFDVRPVWMASPETVAQVFPRKPLFDVVIFDEASQCRLEEALPVLSRGRRVVIAGDPKQLPPTRFFESAAVVNDDPADLETEQGLFEARQSEIEDLLGAALNIEIEESYLDVHYRSRNADLIEFSNRHFYSHRLQAIPAHPSSISPLPPLTLHQVDGVYSDRCNEAEADRVCQIVRELLDQTRPPSIGIACFNITQRDLIIEKLDAAAEEDPAFGKALEEARARRGPSSFEGLFVKNLENVQGDERDQIIISTTYGPDPQGRFYRRFGPLGQPGGGRRLNVLVTRARQEVQVVTSIPQSAYRALPPVPSGQAPNGGWLLFAYIQFAEQLADAYRDAQARAASPAEANPASVQVRETRYPSAFAQTVARLLHERHGIGSSVNWGNDGFSIDLALKNPRHPEDVTLGLLCDFTRFAQAADPVEWDLFRSGILRSQGWKLDRIWSPDFFRDPDHRMEQIAQQARAADPANGA